MKGIHTNVFTALFPPPRFMSMPAAGIDISDTSIKYFDARLSNIGYIPNIFDVQRIPHSIVKDGVVEDAPLLADALLNVKKTHNRHFANVALPEELVYLYTLEVPSSHKRHDILQIIEFSLSDHVPIPVENAVFNFDIIKKRGDITDISVTVFPKDVIETYRMAFKKSGFYVKAFELEAYAIARAVVPKHTKGVSMIVDFGRTRTGITITVGQVPVFSTTVKIGGEIFTEVIMKHLHVTEEQADIFKWEKGMDDRKNTALYNDLKKTMDALSKEIQRHYRYWNTRHNEDEHLNIPITQTYLCGGALALRGLKEHIADVLNVSVRSGNVWVNMFNIDAYIPIIKKEKSWSYATAVGLFLRDIS